MPVSGTEICLRIPVPFSRVESVNISKLFAYEKKNFILLIPLREDSPSNMFLNYC